MKSYFFQKMFFFSYFMLFPSIALATMQVDPVLTVYEQDKQILFIAPRDGLANTHFQKHLSNTCADITATIKGVKDYATTATSIATTTAYYKLFTDLSTNLNKEILTDSQLLTLYKLISAVLNTMDLNTELPATAPAIVIPAISSSTQPSITLADRSSALEQLHQACMQFVATNYTLFIPEPNVTKTCKRTLLRGILDAFLIAITVEHVVPNLLRIENDNNIKRCDTISRAIGSTLISYLINELIINNDSPWAEKMFESVAGKLLSWVLLQTYAPAEVRNHKQASLGKISLSFLSLLILMRCYLNSDSPFYTFINALGFSVEFFGKNFEHLITGNFQEVTNLTSASNILFSGLHLSTFHMPQILEVSKKHLPSFMNRKTTNRAMQGLIGTMLRAFHSEAVSHFGNNDDNGTDHHDIHSNNPDNTSDNHNS